MNPLHKSFGLFLVAILVLALAVGCGEDDLDASNADADADDQNTDKGCPEGQIENRVSGECMSAPGNNDDEVDCDDGEEFDSDLDECILECPVGDSYNPDTEECENDPTVNDPQDNCDDGYEWDTDFEECVEQAECGPGEILGQTCRPDGGIMPGAEVSIEGIDCDGFSFNESTTADSDGFYDFSDIPAGQHEITIVSGSFELVDNVLVRNDQTTDLTSESAKLCLDGTEVNIAVIPGIFDDIGSLLDGMQIDYDSVTNSLVNDLNAMRDYDIIFAECSASLPAGNDAAANVRRYVEEGNSLYASDLADNYIKDTLPGAMNFYSGSVATGTYTADVVSPEMLDLLGTDTIDIELNSAGWSLVESLGPASEAHFRADAGSVDDAPLMSTYDDPIGGGRAIFTSFHNSAQATGDMQDILEFMIFQL